MITGFYKQGSNCNIGLPVSLPRNLIPFFALCLVAILLAGCGSQAVRQTQPTGSEDALDKVTVEMKSEQKKRSVRPISFLMPELNRVVRQQPGNSQPFDGEQCIEAILSAEQAKNLSLARAIANRCDISSLDTEQSETYYLAYHRVLQKQTLWKESRELFDSDDYLQNHIFYSDQAKTQLTLLEARTFEQLGEFWEAAQTRATIAGKVKPEYSFFQRNQADKFRELNNQQLWNDLLQITHEDIVRHIRSTPRSFLLSWLELAEIIKNPVASHTERIGAIENWENYWTDNNILGNWYPPVELTKLKRAASQRVERIAVILPLSGRLTQAGKAVQSGLISANLEANSAYKLRFYDSNNQLFDNLYERAVSEGADLIIGPLEKSRVEQLHTALTEKPVLALNYLTSSLPPPSNVIQFGLAAEDEASQLAGYASEAGLKSILVLHTDRDWANRATETFATRWRSLGGTLLSQTLSAQANYQKEIGAALGVLESEQRKQQLQGLMGKKFEFKPRRRQDIDAVVVFSNSKQLAAIKPLLAYHYAGKLPVLSSSRANSFSEKDRRDLSGVLFVDMPMLLERNRYKSKINRKLNENFQLARLFAMGVDALHLVPELALMNAAKQGRTPGLTGELALQNQRLTRQLKPAMITRKRNRSLSDEQFIDALR